MRQGTHFSNCQFAASRIGVGDLDFQSLLPPSFQYRYGFYITPRWHINAAESRKDCSYYSHYWQEYSGAAQPNPSRPVVPLTTHQKLSPSKSNLWKGFLESGRYGSRRWLRPTREFMYHAALHESGEKFGRVCASKQILILSFSVWGLEMRQLVIWKFL
jgi:hypothetical protein